MALKVQTTQQGLTENPIHTTMHKVDPPIFRITDPGDCFHPIEGNKLFSRGFQLMAFLSFFKTIPPDREFPAKRNTYVIPPNKY
jgi:hypothetical protein